MFSCMVARVLREKQLHINYIILFILYIIYRISLYNCILYGTVSPEECFDLLHLSCPRTCLLCSHSISKSLPCLCCASQTLRKPRYRWKFRYASMIQWIPFQFCSEMSQVSNSSALSSFSSWSRHGMSDWSSEGCERLQRGRLRRCRLCTTPHSCSFGGLL